MAIHTEDIAADDGDHVVHLYEHDSELAEAVASGRELPFSLYCDYPAASVRGSEHAQALHHVCHLHSAVLGGAAVDARRDADGGPCAADGSASIKVVADFAAEHASPGRARRLIVGALAEWGCDAALVQDAAVVASELATNAVLHAGSPFSISAQLEDGLLHVAVEDACPLSVAMRSGGLSPQPTHGLGLIEALSVRWGVEGSPRGKVVWAELSTGADAPQAVR